MNQYDGRSGTSWEYADDFYYCKICPDAQLCKDCLARVKKSTLKIFICDSKHDWLHVPKWDNDEFAEVKNNLAKVAQTP